MWDEISFAFLLLGFLFGCIAIVCFFVFGGQYIACRQSAKVYSMPTSFTLNGCYIKTPDGTMPLEAYEKTLIPNAVYGNGEIKVKVSE